MVQPAPAARRLAIAAFSMALLLAVGTPRVLALELVMFEEDGCPWCAAWDREVGMVYGKTAEGQQAPLRRVDLHGPRPNDLRAITGVIYTPTFVLVEAGRELGRITGYPGEAHFWGLLGHILERIQSETTSSQHPKGS